MLVTIDESSRQRQFLHAEGAKVDCTKYVKLKSKINELTPIATSRMAYTAIARQRIRIFQHLESAGDWNFNARFDGHFAPVLGVDLAALGGSGRGIKAG